MSRWFCLWLLAGCSSPTAKHSADLGAPDLSAVVVSDGGAPDLTAAPIVDASSNSGDLLKGPCPVEMIHVVERDAGLDFCVDPYEGYVVELGDGGEKAHSPYDVVDGLTLRAKTAAHVVPQGYISQVDATKACQNAGKRLCAASEFAEFCRGPKPAGNYYPYGGTTKKAGYCNEGKGSSVALFFGGNANKWTYADFNNPIDNEWDGGLAATASYPHCVSPWGVYDCVGNLHEWGSDPADVNGHGRFRGGFYGDAEVNGHGCLYVTSAHELSYHDYSTGFRCCANVQ